MIRVAVAGACGRMGQEVVRAIHAVEDLRLVAAVDPVGDAGADVGEMAGIGICGVPLERDVERAVRASGTQVLVDFTRGDAAPGNVAAALQAGADAVVGTTGVSAADLERMRQAAAATGRAVLVAPNFALGAVLMMKFAAEAVKYYRWAEIVELHHEKKRDAPSGTALRTAELMRAASPGLAAVDGEKESLTGARGGDAGGVRIHSVRLEGLVAHQEVLLGGTGETLTIRHDSMARTSFMPGVLLAVRRIGGRHGLMVGLEHLMD